jgi:hypothetical protein
VSTEQTNAETSSALVITYEADGCVIAMFHDISICIWATQATLKIAHEIEAVGNRIVASHPQSSTIQVVVNNPALPNAATRDKLNEIMRTFATRLVGVATVLTGNGFWVSAMRSFLTSLFWLSGRSPYKVKICATIPEAVQWLAPLHSARSFAVDPAELERLVARLRNRPSITRLERAAA